MCRPTRTLMALLEVREVWKARRSVDSVRLKLLDLDAARLLQDVCRDAIMALPFGDRSHGRAVIQVTVEQSEDREDEPTTPLLGVLPPALSKQFFRDVLTARAICTAPLANLELPTVNQLAEAIATTIIQRVNTPPELQHAQWLTDTMAAAGVEMHHHHTEPTLLRVGEDNLCDISLGKEYEEFKADTLRLAVALTSTVALLRAVRLRTIVIYLTESEFDPSELLIHPFSQTVREAKEMGGNTGHNPIRCAAIGMRKKARKTPPASLALRADRRPIYTLTMQLTAHHHSIVGSTRGTDRTEQWCKTVATSCGKIKATPTEADDEEELELNYEQNDNVMEVDAAQATTELLAQSSPASQPEIAAELASLTAESHELRNPQIPSIQLEHHPRQPPPPGKGKVAKSAKHNKKQPRGRSRSDGAACNRSRSKPRLSGTHGSDNEWETDDDAGHPSSNSLQ
eukprot:jgi/Tetstr1/448848/TSEL_036074.t1